MNICDYFEDNARYNPSSDMPYTVAYKGQVFVSDCPKKLMDKLKDAWQD
jgi:hypothetical protein